MASFSILAQDEKAFQAFGKQVFDEVIDTNHLYYVQYIWEKDYHGIIDKQNLPYNQKEMMKYRITDNFSNLYQEFQSSLDYLWEEYTRERKEGAKMEYLKTEWLPLENTKYTYEMKVTFLYTSERVKTDVSIVFDVGWTGEHFALISGIEEDF